MKRQRNWKARTLPPQSSVQHPSDAPELRTTTRSRDGPHKQPSIRDERGEPSLHQIDGHKVVLAPHDVKYSREDHDQRQAEGSKRRELRFDSGHRRHDQADASKKLTDPDEDEQVLLTPSPPGQRQAPVSGSPAKRIREKNLEFHRFLLLCSFARVPAGAFLFNLI